MWSITILHIILFDLQCHPVYIIERKVSKDGPHNGKYRKDFWTESTDNLQPTSLVVKNNNIHTHQEYD